MVAVPVGQVADDGIAAGTYIYPGVFIAIGNVMQDRIAAARAETNSACTPHVLLCVGESEVVADQVNIGAIGQQNTVRAVVIGGISADSGIGGAVDVDTSTGAARYRTARETDMVVRDRDVVRAKNINTIVWGAGDCETVDHDVTLARDAEGTAAGCRAVTSHADAWRSGVGDGQANRAGIRSVDCLGVGASQHLHSVARHCQTGGFADGTERCGGSARS